MASSVMSATGRGDQRPFSARIGKYEVEAEIGHSAIIQVFRAFDRDTGRPVTLKVLTGVADRPLLERFRREVACAANLRSPSIIAIYELGEHVGLPFAAMQHLGGDDLRRAIQTKRPLTLLQKMLIMWQVADGVQAAHRGGLAYVGIRPSGIVLGNDGSVTIQDFGMVRLRGVEQSDGASYEAPEESAPGFLQDSLCDIFAFGTVFYELLTGKHPFPDLNGEPAPLRDMAPDCPEALERLVAHALERQRELRYQSLDDVQYDAEPILRELKRSRAAALVSDAGRLIDKQELDQAQTVVREALELDPGNQEAHHTRTLLRGLLQQSTVRPRIEALLREADLEAASRRFARAVEILKAALRLDSSNLEAQSRLEQLGARLEQSQRSARLAAEARQLLDQQSLAEAHGKAAEALAEDPQSAEALELLDRIGAEINRRELEARVDEELARAKSLLLLQSFDAALEVLRELREECPDFPVVTHWLAHVETQKAEAQERASALAAALKEVQWLLDQDRPDLALQFLKDKSADFPNEPDFDSRLAAIEQILPDWEKRRFIQDSLGRAAALEQRQQWPVALTVLEEALESAPASGEILEAAERLRQRLKEQERRKKLARRLETIGQRITGQSWPQALLLIETAQAEFPDEPELQSLLEQARRGLRRSECERIVAEVRQCLADGETEQAEDVLRKGPDALREEPALEALRQELEADKKYREEWRTAQVYFGRGQYQEAEQILVRLAEWKRPEVRALLDTVRGARAAGEEENFYARGREKALKLMQQRQFEQAADLLRNLLSLFPADPILERDLQAAQMGRSEEPPAPAPAASQVLEAPEPPRVSHALPSRVPPPAPAVRARFRVSVPARTHVAAVASLALLVLVSASAAVWRLSRSDAPGPSRAPALPVRKTTVTRESHNPFATPQPAPPKSAPAKLELREAVPAAPDAAPPQAKTAPAVPLRPFTLPAVARADTARAVAPLIPPPPGTAVVVYESGASGVPASVLAPVNLPAPPPSKPPVATPETVAPPAPKLGGNVQDPKLISSPQPLLPEIAKARNMSGIVKLDATIDQRGTVTNVAIVSGNPILASAAKDAVMRWRYQPATLNGQPLEVHATIQVVFESSRR